MVIFHPSFKNGLEHAHSNEGEGVRLALWREAFKLTAENPISGVGAGATGSHSSKVLVCLSG